MFFKKTKKITDNIIKEIITEMQKSSFTEIYVHDTKKNWVSVFTFQKDIGFGWRGYCPDNNMRTQWTGLTEIEIFEKLQERKDGLIAAISKAKNYETSIFDFPLAKKEKITPLDKKLISLFA